MSFIAGSQLVRRSDAELGALLHVFNAALARTEPFSTEWQDAMLSVNSILKERKRRMIAPAPRPF